jgi:hypothetical protein
MQKDGSFDTRHDSILWKKFRPLLSQTYPNPAWTKLRMDSWHRILNKYFCASQAHCKYDPPRNFLYLKQLKFDGGYCIWLRFRPNNAVSFRSGSDTLDNIRK